MPSQREIRRRISSVRNIKQITRAMQFVAASKLKRAQEAALAARPYSEKLDEVLADLAAGDADPLADPAADLLGQGLAVRPVRGGIRITIRNEQDDERLLRALQ